MHIFQAVIDVLNMPIVVFGMIATFFLVFFRVMKLSPPPHPKCPPAGSAPAARRRSPPPPAAAPPPAAPHAPAAAQTSTPQTCCSRGGEGVGGGVRRGVRAQASTPHAGMRSVNLDGCCEPPDSHSSQSPVALRMTHPTHSTGVGRRSFNLASCSEPTASSQPPGTLRMTGGNGPPALPCPPGQHGAQRGRRRRRLAARSHASPARPPLVAGSCVVRLAAVAKVLTSHTGTPPSGAGFASIT